MTEYLSGTYRRGVEHRPVREIAKNWMTLARLPFESRRARQLVHDGTAPKLHLGCGDTYLAGWVNIDLARPGRQLDLRWDLRRGLPFPSGTVGAIFSEHVFEHIPLPGSLALLKECRRVLVPGGIFRIGVPDLERYIHAYRGDDSIIEQVRPGRPTRAIAIGEIFYFHGHRMMYDYETLELMLQNAGFENVERSAFGQGALQPQPDSEHRRPETLYVEATVEWHREK